MVTGDDLGAEMNAAGPAFVERAALLKICGGLEVAVGIRCC
jgi:hypothetical protein